MISLNDRIAQLLRSQGADPKAVDQFSRYGSFTFSFGDVEVLISERFRHTEPYLEVGVNWKAIGTVGAEATWKMALDLQHAAGLAEMVQNIIDGGEQCPT
jgi:hypothetical protein